MKKVKDQLKKTQLGQKRWAKSLKRKHKRYNPNKFIVFQGKAIPEAEYFAKSDVIAETEILQL